MSIDWKNLPRPIIALSPMADMTDSAFCRIIKSKAAPIVFREMVSSEAVVRGNQKTLNMTAIHPDERPIVQQLFGSDPEIMAEAASIISTDHHPEGFDINMGCPVYKIVHHFNGASLMREPKRAAEIVRRMKAAVSVPVSVKIRAGWIDSRECLDFGRVLEDAGADLITIHGRTKTQGYSGQSNWNIIRELKSILSIPVLANGDIHTAPKTLEALKITGCDGVLIARGALGNPWIFLQIEEMLANRTPQTIALTDRINLIKKHLGLHIEQYGPTSVVTFRKHLSWYFKGLENMKQHKEALHKAITAEEVYGILDELLPS